MSTEDLNETENPYELKGVYKISRLRSIRNQSNIDSVNIDTKTLDTPHKIDLRLKAFRNTISQTPKPRQQMIDQFNKSVLRPLLQPVVKKRMQTPQNFIQFNQETCFSTKSRRTSIQSKFNKISFKNSLNNSPRAHEILDRSFLTQIEQKHEKQSNKYMGLQQHKFKVQKQDQKRMQEYARKKKLELVLQQENLEAPESPPVEDVYDFQADDPKDTKNLKTIQRQMDLNAIIEQNPVLVGANPRILSVNAQPNIDIITTSSLRKEKKKNRKNEEISNVESKIIRLGGVEYHKTLCHHQLGIFPPGQMPIKSEGYDLTRAQIRKKNLFKNVEQKKLPKITYNDFSKYYCDFDGEIENNQDSQMKQVMQLYHKNNYLLMDEEQENSSAFSMSHKELLAIEENSENVQKDIHDDAETKYKILKQQKRIVKARENRLQQYKDEVERLNNLKNNKKKGTGLNKSSSIRPSISSDMKLGEHCSENHSHDDGASEVAAPYARTNSVASKEGSQKSKCGHKAVKQTKDNMLQEELKRLQVAYEDVNGSQPDLKNDYKTHIPEWMQESKKSREEASPLMITGDPRSIEARLIQKKINLIEDKITYESQFIKKKKQHELEMLADNKESDFQKQILGFTKTEYQRREKLEKFKKIQKQVKMREVLNLVEQDLNFQRNFKIAMKQKIMDATNKYKSIF